MRIFVMFGTQDKRFDRLLNAILNSNFVNENEVYVQLGYTKGDYSGINGQEYYTEDELNHQIEIADLIITHAGVGAIVSALKLKKRVIVVPLSVLVPSSVISNCIPSADCHLIGFAPEANESVSISTLLDTINAE